MGGIKKNEEPFKIVLFLFGQCPQGVFLMENIPPSHNLTTFYSLRYLYPRKLGLPKKVLLNNEGTFDNCGTRVESQQHALSLGEIACFSTPETLYYHPSKPIA